MIPFVVGIGLTARGDASTGMLLIGIGALGMLAAMRVGRLVTDHERLQRRLEHEAAHDRLTSLPNRGEFVRWSLARTQQSTLLFLDLDGFKQVNDTWGHAAGDELLVTIAERISELAADRGIAARFAGDEFVLVFEGLHPDSVPVAQLVDDLRVSIARPVDVGAASVLVGVSIGVAELDVDDIDASRVLADASMYVDKRSRSTRDRAHAIDAA